MKNNYFEMDSLELNIAIANLHPIAIHWMADLLIEVRYNKRELAIMELIMELMCFPKPLDTFHLLEAMWLEPEEIDFIKPIVTKIMANPDYYIAEFMPENAQEDNYGDIFDNH